MRSNIFASLFSVPKPTILETERPHQTQGSYILALDEQDSRTHDLEDPCVYVASQTPLHRPSLVFKTPSEDLQRVAKAVLFFVVSAAFWCDIHSERSRNPWSGLLNLVWDPAHFPYLNHNGNLPNIPSENNPDS